MNRFDQEQDELPLRTPVTSSSRDREYTLSTGMVLSIFFALALVCSIFFGFGYTLGRKSMQPAMASNSASEGGDTAAFSKFKPAAGSATGSTAPAYTAPKQDTAPAAVSTSAAASTPSEIAPRQTAPAQTSTPAAPVVRTAAPAAPVPAPTAAAGGTTMVQIAAVSHPEDADVLTAALKRRGYSVLARQESGDHLIHVQVGPFATRKDAEVMRQKLLNDGYNAILK